MPLPFDLLKSWGLSASELSSIVAENPSMRGLMFGFVAEYQLRKGWLLRPEITELSRPRAHDPKAKGDFKFVYGGEEITLEVKGLDTPKVRGDDAMKISWPLAPPFSTEMLPVLDRVVAARQARARAWRL